MGAGRLSSHGHTTEQEFLMRNHLYCRLCLSLRPHLNEVCMICGTSWRMPL